MIQHAISSSPDLCDGVRSYSTSCKPTTGSIYAVLVLDTCSVEHWQQLLEKWHSEGGLAIALITAESRKQAEELQMLFLGATGIVSLSENLIHDLPNALRTILRGELWVSRSILNEYVKRTNLLLRRLSPWDRLLTAREEHILKYLRQGFSNKQIANVLGISERTTKFHVSNLLKKCKLQNRKEFLNASFGKAPGSYLLSLISDDQLEKQDVFKATSDSESRTVPC